jgi:predicted GTPase
MRDLHAWVVLNRSMVERAMDQDSAFADHVAALLHFELPVRINRLEKALESEDWALVREQTLALGKAINNLKCNVLPGLCRLIVQECDALGHPVLPICNLIEFARILMFELKTLSNQENSVLKPETIL